MTHLRPTRVAAAAALGLAGILAAGLAIPTSASAHGFERPFPLPVPLALYLGGAAAAVFVSFVVTAVVGRASDQPRYRLREAPRWIESVLGRAAPVIGLAWWLTIIVSGISGTLHAFVPAVLWWVLLWVGIPTMCVLIGNPWPAISPFRAVVWLIELGLRPLGLRALSGFVEYPPALSRWPAVAFLFGALSFELVLPGSFAGDTIGWWLLWYSVLTLVGIVTFGATPWLRNAELLEVLFGWFGRIGPVGRRSVSAELCAACPEGCNPDRCIDCPDCTAARAAGEQRLVLRPWFAGLTEVRAANWSDAGFILLALAGVSYDGLRETVAWGTAVQVMFDPVERIVGSLNALILLDGIGLTGMWAIFLLAFAVAAWLTRRLTRERRPLTEVAGAYAATLLPIAGGYLVAHYFTLLMQGVMWLPSLFIDRRSVAPDVSFVPAEVIWYVSVAAIVIGHIAAVVLAHRIAVREGRARAVLVGAPLVLLMLAYTVFSLWIIAQPLTIEPH